MHPTHPSSNSELAPPSGQRFMRRPEVQRLTSLSRSSLYRLIAAGEFPAPIRLSAVSVAWLATEVSLWISERVAHHRRPIDPTTCREGG